MCSSDLDRKLTGATSKLEWLANHSEQEDVQWLSIQVLCSEENSHAHQKHFLHHHDHNLHTAALSGMLLSANNESKLQAEKIISSLISSPSKEEKIIAIKVLNQVKDSYSHAEHYRLFNTEEKSVRLNAIDAVGKAATFETLNQLIKIIAENKKHVLDALQAAGENSAEIGRAHV